ncbi:hypothetical protein ACWD33_03415 [Streptomyces xiamenensis]
MPGYEQLNNVDFRSLDAAIEDWRQTKGDLDALAAEAAQGLLSKIEASQWRGENATVSREFIIRAGSEFEYAHQQAQAVFTILTDFRAVLAAHQRSLQELAQEARQQGLYVQANGTVIEQPDGPYSDLGLEQSGPLLGPGTSSRQADIDHFAARIQAVLAEAATQDETTARALRENIGEEREHFAPVTAESLFDGARAQGIADAQEYLDLIESEAYNTQEGIDRLNELAAAQSHNEHFATYLATGLGAEGTLEFWADVLDGPESGEVSDAYRESVLQLRENLGVTFGTASESHRDGMDAWRNDMIALGSERIGTGAAMNPYGFQIMSDLMMHGNYNKDWLVDYGAGLVNAEQEMAFDTAQFWANAAPVEEYRRVIGDEYRADPFTGFMRALGNNPDAATAFLLTEDPQDYAEYIVTVRETPRTDGDAVHEETGQALFAAATGINPHDPAALYVEHTADHDAARDRVLALGSALGNDFPPEFRDPMAKILVNHGGAVIDTTGSQLAEKPLIHRDLSVVATQISRDPGSYGILNEGINYFLVESFHDTETASGSPLAPEDTLARAGQTVGFLEQARNDALYGEMAQEESDAAWNARWQYHAFGSVANFIPELGDIVQRGVDVYTQAWLDDELARIEGEYSEERYVVTESRVNQLGSLANAWYEVNSKWADEETDYRTESGRANKIGEAALLGRDTK